MQKLPNLPVTSQLQCLTCKFSQALLVIFFHSCETNSWGAGLGSKVITNSWVWEVDMLEQCETQHLLHWKHVMEVLNKLLELSPHAHSNLLQHYKFILTEVEEPSPFVFFTWKKKWEKHINTPFNPWRAAVVHSRCVFEEYLHYWYGVGKLHPSKWFFRSY